MRVFSVIALIVAVFTGCGRSTKEVSSVDRAKAVQLAADAQRSSQSSDHAKAATLLSQATELDPDVPAYWSGLGDNLLRTGDVSAARKACKRLLALHETEARKTPKDPKPWLSQIGMLVTLDRSDDARKLLARALKEFPDDGAVRNFNERGSIDAILSLEQVRAAQLAAESDRWSQELEYKKATSCLKQATEFDPANPSYWWALGDSRVRVLGGDTSEARKNFQRALNLYESLEKKSPNDPDHLFNQIQLLVILNRVDDAEKMLKRGLKAFPTDRNLLIAIDTGLILQMAGEAKYKGINR